ncbi:hypothetical protein [Streptomyces sp. NBC_01439]|uniref:hypothetical protein n=1 Tax=Streptomyces sp. NBC_01439 TaxID=2903867 RepID=UPI002E2A4FD7|nr:hypothetical protein [Streptomyces sp. NBC_01439]
MAETTISATTALFATQYGGAVSPKARCATRTLAISTAISARRSRPFPISGW